MEIQIPMADQDTGTEGQLTDRTGCQTVSDGWSREGHVSTSDLTSRSLALSRASQPVSHVVQLQRDDAGSSRVTMENGELEMNGSIHDTEFDTRIGSLESPETGREVGLSDERSLPEDTYRSTRLAAEEARDRYLAAPSVDSQERETESEQGSEIPEQKVPEIELEQASVEVESEPGAAEDAAETEQKSAEPIATAPCDDGGSSGTNVEETVVDGDGDQNEEGFSNGDCNSNEPDDQGGKGSEAGSEVAEHNLGSDSEVPEHNLGSGFVSEDADTPRGVEQSRDEDASQVADTAEPDAGTGAQQDGGVFLTESSNQPGDEGSDISDVRAETPDWAEEGEENDGASVSDVCGVSRKPGRSSATSRPRPLTRSTLHEDVAPGQRAVVNTPVSYLTATDFQAELARNVESR